MLNLNNKEQLKEMNKNSMLYTKGYIDSLKYKKHDFTQKEQEFVDEFDILFKQTFSKEIDEVYKKMFN